MTPAATIPWYWKSLDFAHLARDYPPPPDFFDTVYRMPRERLREVQEARFLKTVARGWEIPFFERRWRAAGLEPGDIRGLDDLVKIPPYTVDDIRASIERHPPFGDFMGLSPADGARVPLVLQTSGGTTGLPRPMLYAPQDRETMAIMGGRRLAMQGVRPGDKVLVTYSLGLSNGGFAAREAIWKYSGAVPVMTGSGASTPTRRQVEIIRAWGIDVILGFPAYLRHMALVARDEMGIDPRTLGVRVLGSHLGIESRAEIEALWNAPCQDMYGANESGTIAADCEHRNGLHIFEDALLLEIADPETGRILPDGEKGTVYITTLFRWSAPQIRFNINDISAIATGRCACGSTLRRLEKIYGRNDNMVKLRGVNVFPEAIGGVVSEDKRTNGEYFCVVERIGEAGRDEMTVMVEVARAEVDRETLRHDLERRLKEVLGVKVVVQPADPHALDELTGVARTSKIRRLADRRK